MPEFSPYITLNDEGICNLCVEYEKKPDLPEERLHETDLVKIFNKNKSKGKYDCLVMCSGGKDSTSALYYMKRRYKLNPLAFTFDHGFETEEALANIKNAVEKLGVDFLFFKTDFMKEMFSKILKHESKAIICHPCSIWYMDLTYDLAAKFDIPIIVAGWTKGQSTKQTVMSKCACNIDAPEFKSMGEETKKFIEEHVKNDPRYKNFPDSMEEVLRRAKKRHKAIVISPHWFLPYGPEIYVETISKELGWKQPKESYPHRTTNCALNFLSVHNSMKHYGYTHYHVEMSKLIRQGIITREEALADLEINFDNEYLNSIAAKLGHKLG